MNDSKQLEHYLQMIKPDIIIHLAAISSSQYAFNNPIEALQTNGILTAKICDIIHKNNWNTKLFNASSSEIYKGHVNYIVEEDDHNMFHSHPYSIAKIMGHSIVDFYRKTYNLPFSNGIIFTTESNKKKPVFLLNKVAQHIKQWKSGDKKLLKVGNLDSYKNILHATDVANAIRRIIEQEKGDNYLICSKKKYRILDLVLQLYSQGEIDLEQKENIFFEKKTGFKVLVIENNQLGIDSIPINIIGNPTKLIALGWNPQISIDNILEELL
jgi:GDPmannose 4,6-dehydratase